MKYAGRARGVFGPAPFFLFTGRRAGCLANDFFFVALFAPGAVAEVPSVGGVLGLGGAPGVHFGGVQADVGLHAVEADGFNRVHRVRGREVGVQGDLVQACGAGEVQQQRREVEGVVDVVVLAAVGLVAERAWLRFERAFGQRKCVAALIAALIVVFVLPCVQKRIGDYVLLLDRDLVDDQVG